MVWATGRSQHNNAPKTGAGENGHRHFGYWINRGQRMARCYECGFQFGGSEDTAEDWLG